MKVESLSVGLIDRPKNPHRLDFDENAINELADSIRTTGLINPIRVKRAGDRYEVIAGDCRLQAHRILGRATIDAVINDNDTTTHAIATQIAENFQRSDLSPIEEARAIALAMNDHDLNTNQVASLINRSHQWIEQRLSLLELPDDLGPLVHQRRLPMAAALALARCTDPEHRAQLTEYALTSGANTMVISAWVQKWQAETAAGAAPTPPPPAPTEPGQQQIILMPCWLCGKHQDYTTMTIARIGNCCRAMQNELMGVTK